MRTAERQERPRLPLVRISQLWGEPRHPTAQACAAGTPPEGSPREPDRVRATFSRNPRDGVVKTPLIASGYLVLLDMNWLYACASEAEGIISIRSASGRISFSASRLRAIHGFVYTRGSSMTTVSSSVF